MKLTGVRGECSAAARSMQQRPLWTCSPSVRVLSRCNDASRCCGCYCWSWRGGRTGSIAPTQPNAAIERGDTPLSPAAASASAAAAVARVGRVRPRVHWTAARESQQTAHRTYYQRHSSRGSNNSNSSGSTKETATTCCSVSSHHSSSSSSRSSSSIPCSSRACPASHASAASFICAAAAFNRGKGRGFGGLDVHATRQENR